MQKWLLIVCLLACQDLLAQKGMLFVKKRGIKKVFTFNEGASIRFTTRDQQEVSGVISLVKGDSLHINGYWHRTGNIAVIYKRAKINLTAPLLYTTGLVAVASTVFSFTMEETFGSAFAKLGIIGYGNVLVRNFSLFKRKKYRIGKKFTLQTLDLRF